MVKKNFAFGMQLSVFLSKNGMGVSKVQNFIFVDSGQATFSFRLEKVCPSSKKICPFIIIKVKKKKKQAHLENDRQSAKSNDLQIHSYQAATS